MRRSVSGLSRLPQMASWLLLAAALTLTLVIIGMPVEAELPDPEAGSGLQHAPLAPQFLEGPSMISYGYISPPFDLSHVEAPAVSGVRLQEVPDSFDDWREDSKVTSVKDQYPCGMCWAFGTASVLESAVLIGEGATYDFSEQSVGLCVDRSWTYLYDAGDDPCHAGGNVFLASEVFIKKGAVSEICVPYDPDALHCGGKCVCDSCPALKMVDGFRLVTNDGSQIDAIKNAVYDKGPVAISYFHDEAYVYSDPMYGTIYDYYPSPGSANHLVSIVGWDDDVPHPNAAHDGTGAWIAKNSWGTEWGDDGYFYLTYDSSNATQVAYLQYKDPNPDEELLYWDEAGLVDAIGYEHETAWMANVFAASEDKAITHIDFWTTDSNAEYEIYVWDGASGSQLAHQTGSCQEMGYYSVPLSTPVSMSAGQQFTVGVKMTTPGYGYPIPVEYAISGVVDPPIQSGVSFIRHPADDSWSDLAEYGYNASLRVRMVDSGPTPTPVTPTPTPAHTSTPTTAPPTATNTAAPMATDTPTSTATKTSTPFVASHRLALPLIIKH